MTNVCEVAIAGLLHDTGKLLQRARAPLSDQAERMEQTLCPTAQGGRATHRHVLWTSDFVEALADRLPADLDASDIKRLASRHHRPAEPDEWLIAEANRLASGYDRRPEDGEDRPRDFRQVPLYCGLARLGLTTETPCSEGTAWLPVVLQPDETIRPRTTLDPAEVERAWRPLAESMIAEAEGLDLSGLSSGLAVQALSGLAERYLSLMPDSSIDRADTSLYDHCAVTAALASAMLRYHEIQGDLAEPTVRDRKAVKFRFLVGSSRGIQDFIFTLPHEQQRGIAKAYRANSFYVSALTEAVVLRLLKAARLPAVNCVLNAGGRFVILADATDETFRALADEERAIQAWLVDNQLGMLRLNLAAGVVASGQDLLGDGFPGVYRRLEHQAALAKERPLSAWLLEGDAWTAKRFIQGTNPEHVRQRNTDRAREVGKVLPRASTFALFPKDASPAGLLSQPLDALGFQLQLGGGECPVPAAESRFARRLGTDAEGTAWLPHRPMANYIPRRSEADVEHLRALQPESELAEETDQDEDPMGIGGPLTFGQLALLSRRPVDGEYCGRAMLACLKADVDRLGLLFSRGYGEDLSFARLASLSRFMDLFFKGYLTHQFEAPDSPYRLVYTVFAGGDDLMLIGPWHVMFRLASDVRAWLDAFTGGNPSLTLSAGLVLVHPRTPPSQMARAGEEALDSAKNAGRNRITVLGRVLTWEQFEQGLEHGRRLDAMLCRRGDDRSGVTLNTAFVYRLLQHARSAERVGRKERAGERIPVADLTWRSHYAYDLHRNVERRLPDSPTAGQQEDLQWLQTVLPLSVRQKSVAPVILGATYALYLNRGGSL